ncbi:hypothetical protein CWI36_0308p0010 [Hamiltosporidium magnivora]|uniref:Uncharacterized protein n=1 Tax=Hamiltosporidium magnivora TaxID=148818 RepID=A0A4Q9LEX8_9MICR|nr:hypothetical protein CWI36_0640p0010 [Hamiltosporidium magnivora]TBU07213.1 hypothetical protein CWI36_0308p0010 [Hamiltosporidium magnivora]
MKHLNIVVCVYNRTIHGATNKYPFMLFFGQPGFNNPLPRSIIVENEANPGNRLGIHEEFTETVTTTTTIIADYLEINSKIRSDIAKHFKNYRERILETTIQIDTREICLLEIKF